MPAPKLTHRSSTPKTTPQSTPHSATHNQEHRTTKTNSKATMPLRIELKVVGNFMWVLETDTFTGSSTIQDLKKMIEVRASAATLPPINTHTLYTSPELTRARVSPHSDYSHAMALHLPTRSSSLMAASWMTQNCCTQHGLALPGITKCFSSFPPISAALTHH